MGRAPASGACERGNRGGAKARSRRRRSRAGGSELGRCGWWRGHRSVRRAACVLLHKHRLGRPVVTADGRVPPSIAPSRPSRVGAHRVALVLRSLGATRFIVGPPGPPAWMQSNHGNQMIYRWDYISTGIGFKSMLALPQVTMPARRGARLARSRRQIEAPRCAHTRSVP